MFRKKDRMFFGLRAQMLLGLLLIFLFFCLTLSWMTGRRLRLGREEQIARELQNIQANIEIYVRQLLILNEANYDESSFRNLAEDMAEELWVSGANGLSVYTRDGELLAYKEKGYTGGRTEGEKQDLAEAMDGRPAFLLLYSEDRLDVLFSMPVTVENKSIGIIRCRLDYTSLWKQGREIETMILRTAGAVFAAAFLLTALFLNRILKPIERLSGVSGKITGDLERGCMDTELLSALAGSRRRDEVGELARSYSKMMERIDRYIRKMQEDRDRIQELLESRQEFYNNVTHELKTPLTTIQGYAQLLEADMGQDKELLEKGTGHILHESTRLHHMVVELLEMSDRPRQEEKRPVDLGLLVRSVAETMKIRADRYGCRLRLELADSQIVWGLEERLRQVVINLLDNALKYGEPGEEIRLRVTGIPEGSLLCVGSREANSLSDQELEKIFEPFYRADKEYSREQGSAGLGLSICRKIMEEHGGSIWAERGERGWLWFSLIFPSDSKDVTGKEIV